MNIALLSVAELQAQLCVEWLPWSEGRPQNSSALSLPTRVSVELGTLLRFPTISINLNLELISDSIDCGRSQGYFFSLVLPILQTSI